MPTPMANRSRCFTPANYHADAFRSFNEIENFGTDSQRPN